MAAIVDQERLREEEKRAVGPLLARAKLFRVRGQWDEAIAACTDALRRFPGSVTACSLLGEIYEAQGRLEDAAQWYAMVLERDPTSATDRAGWERVAAAQRARQSSRAQEAAATGKTNSVPAIAAKAERTLEWFDRVFPPGDSKSIARMLYAVSAVLAGVLVVSAGIFYLFFQNKARRNETELPPPGSAIVGLPTPSVPVVVEPLRVAPVAGTPTAAPTVSVEASPTPAGVNAEDGRLAAYLNRSLNGAFVVQSLRRDNGRVFVELLVPAGETLDKSRETVLRAAGLTARLVGQADAVSQTVTIQALMPSLTTPGTPVSVFAGDVAVASIREIDPLQLGYVDLVSRFTRLQWEGPLVPNPESNAPNGVPTNGNTTSGAANANTGAVSP